MEENIFYLSMLTFLVTSCIWYLTKMWQIDNSKKEKIYLEEELRKSEEYRRKELEDVSRFYAEKIDYMKTQAREVYGVPKMQNPPLPPPKKDKKFKKQELVNLELKDSITGDLLDTVKCKCGSYYSRDTYAIHGCPNCKQSIVNKKIMSD